MPKYKSKKELITEAVLAQFSVSTEPLDKYINKWWMTKNGDGLRLSPEGNQAFKDAQIECYNIPLPIVLSGWYGFIVECNRKLQCPYFISVNKTEQGKKEPYIILYDSKIAMLVTLYGGIKDYLESINDRRKEK